MLILINYVSIHAQETPNEVLGEHQTEMRPGPRYTRLIKLQDREQQNVPNPKTFWVLSPRHGHPMMTVREHER